MHACNCIGPQNGQPRCPCLMRGVTVVDGRYVSIDDLGPVEPKRYEPTLQELERQAEELAKRIAAKKAAE
jgi:hypothetical protein